MIAARWMVLLAAVHRWSGPAILAGVLAGVIAELARKRWAPGELV